MLFADRVVLVEGPSEQKLLPRISPLVPCSTGGSPCDFDKLNTSVVPVGGKSRFGPFAALLDQFGISWRVIADSDALTGDSLATFKASARITPDMCPDEQRRRLREVGVAVLSDGEIEDYYPIEALADLAGENPDTMQQRIDAAKTSYEMPEGIGFVEAIISQHQREIADAKPERVGKLVQCWYSQTVQQLRDQGQVAQTVRKLGESLEKAVSA